MNKTLSFGLLNMLIACLEQIQQGFKHLKKKIVFLKYILEKKFFFKKTFL